MNRPQVTLALQGGGSHGAFTWGVLDRLLEDDRVEIEGLSGASAGAMNAVVLAHGMTLGGPAGARAALQSFWDAIGANAVFGTASGDPSPFLSMIGLFSPRQFNPLDINPLRDILDAQVDFARLREACTLELFIATTHVASGLPRLFRTRQITRDMLLASACIPGLQHAIEIDGEAYWDGGLTANPPIFPLVEECASRDLILVPLQPAPRRDTPTSVEAIRNRLSEISFSSAFFSELQALALARHTAGRSAFSFGRPDRALRQLRIHSIDAPELMGRLSAPSKLNVHPEFIHTLRDEGRACAGAWLARNFDRLGERSSFDLDAFLRQDAEAGPRTDGQAAGLTPPPAGSTSRAGAAGTASGSASR